MSSEDVTVSVAGEESTRHEIERAARGRGDEDAAAGGRRRPRGRGGPGDPGDPELEDPKKAPRTSLRSKGGGGMKRPPTRARPACRPCVPDVVPRRYRGLLVCPRRHSVHRAPACACSSARRTYYIAAEDVEGLPRSTQTCAGATPSGTQRPSSQARTLAIHQRSTTALVHRIPRHALSATLTRLLPSRRQPTLNGSTSACSDQ